MATVSANSEHLLYSVAQLRAIERAAAAVLPPHALMQRAGQATAHHAVRMFLDAGGHAPMLILAGPGNNGGDALEAAALMAGQRIPLQVALLGDPARLPADAQASLARAIDSGVRFLPAAELSGRWSVAVDGLFGIGLKRPLDPLFADIISSVNAMRCPVLAIDVPSGLDADTGNVVGDVAIRASETLTFIGNKPGLHTAHGRDCAGHVIVERLELASDLFPPPMACLNSPGQFAYAFRTRPHASHKGSFGDLTVIGGDAGMGGAVILASRMGAMAGAGRVFAAFAAAPPAYDPLHPELMCRDARSVELISGAVVVGPGLGLSREAADLVGRALASSLPAVIDADALNLIAAEPGLQARLRARRPPSLLTPHPLEAARLLDTDAADVQANRLAAASEISRRLNAVTVLKGSGTIVAAGDGRLVVNSTGNPALATAGSGDVLAGLCGALLAQGLPAWEAALAAVWLHGGAADDMVAEGIGPVGATASEIPAFVRRRINRL